MRAHWILGLSILLCLACSATPMSASAQNKAAEKSSEYRELIEKALQEYALGHWPEARVFFADAHALSPNARTLRGLGMTCYEERAYVESIGYLEQALESKVQPLTPKLTTEAEGILAQAKRFVSTTYIVTAPADAKLTIDDQPAKIRADGSVLLDPGDHSAHVSSAGYQSEQRRLHAEAGRELHIQIELRSAEALQPSAAAATLPAAPILQDSGPVRDTLARQNTTAAGAFAAVGVVGLATGWVFYAMRDSLRLELWEIGLSGAQGFEQSKFQSFQARGGIALGAAGAGALALSLAQYFWLPDEEPVPTWAWVASGVGGAVALGALGWAAFGQHCEVTERLAFCRSTLSDPLFAPLLAIQSVPLLSLPLMYSVRERVPVRNASLSVAGDAATGGIHVSLSGML
jgi:hypothetical protein